MPGGLIGLLGTGLSMAGAMGAAGASSSIAAAELRLEKQRLLQMKLEANRRRLETIRSMQRARSVSLATATAQNAQLGTGLMGAYGQISGQGRGQIKAVNQNEMIGQNMFDINKEIAGYKMDIADSQMLSALGSGVSSLGGMFSHSGGAMGRVMGGFGGQPTGMSPPSGFSPWGNQSPMMFPGFGGFGGYTNSTMSMAPWWQSYR